MALVSLQNVTFSYGGSPILENVDLSIESSERLCLLGRNGTGKSTLLRLLCGQLEPDAGSVVRAAEPRIGMLPQKVPQQSAGSVYDVVLQGLGEATERLREYHRMSRLVAGGTDPSHLKRLDRLQHEIDAEQGWLVDQQARSVITQMSLETEADFAGLSAGLKRRVLLARAMACRPDLLLLDEPTNHLDIEAIEWLEGFLRSWGGALLFVTHDRRFIRNLSTRLIEIDRKRLLRWNCDYNTYLQRKEQALEAEAGEQARQEKILAQEEQWIRQGIKARRRRNMGRVRQLLAMREEKRQRLTRPGTARVASQEVQLSGRLVIEAKDAVFGYRPEESVIRHLSTTILRGDRIGIIGPNGSGKTTLLRLLLGQLAPQQGMIRHGTNLQIAYFDQLHRELAPEKSVKDNVAEGYDVIFFNGQSRNVYGYLQDFLFSPAQAKQPVHLLSGGERNRLLLARLFSKPSNLLVLDEPTNDLDVETLELLEDVLIDYTGTVLLVSHDRAFLNQVVTSTMALEPEGLVHEYAGGYDDYLAQRKPPTSSETTAKPEPKKSKPKPAGPRKLSYRQRQEFEALPDQIEDLENRLQNLHAAMADPTFYRQASDQIADTARQAQDLEGRISDLYRRWEDLSALE